MKVQQFVNDRVMPVANAIQNNKWIKLLMAAMMGAVPATMVGSIFSMVKAFPLGNWYSDLLNNTGLSDVLGEIANICNLISLFSVIGIGYNLAKMYKENEMQGGLVSLMAFLIVTPTHVKSGETIINNVFSTEWLGSKGLFCAFIIGIAAYQIFHFFYKHNFRIKLPDSVPPMIARSFEGIVPALMVGIVFLIVRYGFEHTSYENVHQFIYALLQKPLSGLGNSLPAFYIALLMMLVLWICGIHGTMLVLGVLRPIWQPAYLENLEAFNAGVAMPHELTQTVLRFVMQFVGGPGNLLGLTICALIFAKSQKYKAISRVSALPACFNIVEPIIYGFPIVANPIIGIPFILAPIINFSLSIILVKVGILPLPGILCEVMATPGILASFSIGGGWQWSVWWVCMLAIAVICYLPFFKIADKIALNEEDENKRIQDENK